MPKAQTLFRNDFVIGEQFLHPDRSVTKRLQLRIEEFEALFAGLFGPGQRDVLALQMDGVEAAHLLDHLLRWRSLRSALGSTLDPLAGTFYQAIFQDII